MLKSILKFHVSNKISVICKESGKSRSRFYNRQFQTYMLRITKVAPNLCNIIVSCFHLVVC